jgi:hypothetical protein
MTDLRSIKVEDKTYKELMKLKADSIEADRRKTMPEIIQFLLDKNKLPEKP